VLYILLSIENDKLSCRGMFQVSTISIFFLEDYDTNRSSSIDLILLFTINYNICICNINSK